MGESAPRPRVAWLEPARLPHGYDDQNVYSGVLTPRAGPKMAALLREHGYDPEVISGETSPIDPDEIAGQFDLACISAISTTAPHALILARQLGERGLPVVLGGYQFAHTRFTPECLAATDEGLDFAPYVVRGEGYRSLPELLAALRGERPLASVGGLSYRDAEGRTRHNGAARLLDQEEINRLPLADWSLVRDRDRMRVTSVHGQQGCPRECSFCAVWTRDGRRNRNTYASRVVDELELALGAGRFWHVFFSADNFPVFRAWAREICEEMLARGIRIPWTCQAEVRTYQATELVDLMVRAGCERWCIGLESINPASLADSAKRQSVEQMAACIREVRRRGIHVHGMFIVGLPHDTPATVDATVAWAKQQGLETVQFLCLADLPGSPDYERQELWRTSFRPFEGALAPLNWMFVNGHYARVASDTMSLPEIQQGMIRAMRGFYSLSRVLAPLLTISRGRFHVARERGRRILGSLLEAYGHSVVCAALRWRGYSNVRQWLRNDFNRAYCELLEAAPERLDALRQRLLDHLPPSWLETLERVHEERLARLARWPQPVLQAVLEPAAEAAG